MASGFPRSARQAEHVAHCIEPGLLALSPARRRERAASKDHPVFGFVSKLDPFLRSGKNDRMVADDRTAAQAREADGAICPPARLPVTGAHLVVAEIVPS